jgi:hypothetical protein
MKLKTMARAVAVTGVSTVPRSLAVTLFTVLRTGIPFSVGSGWPFRPSVDAKRKSDASYAGGR